MKNLGMEMATIHARFACATDTLSLIPVLRPVDSGYERLLAVSNGFPPQTRYNAGLLNVTGKAVKNGYCARDA